MNRFLFFFVILFSFQLLKAQDNNSRDTFGYSEKGYYQLDLHLKGLLAGDYFFEYYGISAGKFFKKHFLAGIEIDRGFYGDWERSFNFGFFMRYYFKTGKKFLFFTQSEYLLGRVYYDNPQTASQWHGFIENLSLNAGISYYGFCKKRIGLSFVSGYDFYYLFVKNHPTLGEYKFSKFDLIYSFQISYYF